MQNTGRAASRLRQRLDKLRREIPPLIDELCSFRALTKGSVYQMKRRCGKPTCICARGKLHASWVLSWSEDGKTRLRSLDKDDLPLIARRASAYTRFRRARARLTKVHQDMLKTIDALAGVLQDEKDPSDEP